MAPAGDDGLSGRRTGARRTALTIAVALMATTACSGGDGDGAPEATVSPTLAIGTLDTVAATPTTEASEPITVDGGTTFALGAVVAGSPQRPWLLVGTQRDAPGAPSRAALFSSIDGSVWTPLTVDAPDHSQARAAVAAPDGSVLVGGSIDRDDGMRPVLWRVADGVVGAPEEIAAEGRVQAMAVAPSGDPALLVATDDGTAVATRTAGTWWTTPVPAAVDPVGIGASETTLVVTGPTTWRSTDRGRTFEVVPTPLSLGAVIGSASGFVAASCTTGGVVLSPDGRMWTELPAAHPRGVAPVPGTCLGIAADDSGGVWLSGAPGGQPMVFRVLDGVVDLLGVPARPPGTIFDGPPLVAAAGGVVVAASPQPGGVAISRALTITLTTGLELDAAMTAATGAPGGTPAPVGVVALDDEGAAAGVLSYPVVTDAADGSYRWTTTIAAAGVDDAGTLVAADGAAPSGPDGSFGAVVATARGDVAIGTVADAEAPAGGGPVGDVVVSLRTDGAWTSREVVLDGPGRQAVVAAVAVGDQVVGVGEQRLADPATGVEQVSPLVIVGDGRSFEPVPVDVPAAISLTGACVGPDGAALALGVDTTTGANVVVTVTPDPPAATAAPGPTGTPLVGCATVGDEVLLASVRSLVVAAPDGTFRPLDVLRPGEDVRGVAVGPSGVAITGSTATGDGFVLHGAAIESLARIDAPNLTGRGDHLPTDVVVRRADVVVLGLADGAPTAWRTS